MKIVHRVTFKKEDNVDDRLVALGIKYKKTPIFERYIITFEIDEADIRWSQVEELIQDKNALDIYDTFFTNEELLNGEWLRLEPTFEYGYPQPEGTWIKNPPNYAYKCLSCGVFQQKSSFIIQKEPELGKNDFMSLHWTHAFFCTPRVFDALARNEIKGYEIWDVLLSETKLPSKQVSQLFVPIITKPGLADQLSAVVCEICGEKKYNVHKKGIMNFQRSALSPNIDTIQTYEWFGHGHNAFREILVSNRLAKVILKNDWQGVRLKLVELV